MRAYKTVGAASMAETVVNKSRFIGRCFPVSSEGEALAFLSELRKKHWDASHNCFAYRIGENTATARFSDDGEPGGTAGKPIMDVLMGKDLTDVLVVVTRYFGGVLLGAGGLVRAYSRSAADAVSAAGEVEVRPALRYAIAVDYSRYGAVETFLRDSFLIESTDFAQNVTLSVLVDATQGESFQRDLLELTDGRCKAEPQGEGVLRRGIK